MTKHAKESICDTYMKKAIKNVLSLSICVFCVLRRTVGPILTGLLLVWMIIPIMCNADYLVFLDQLRSAALPAVVIVPQYLS